MASDFDFLQDQLALMVGADDASQLPVAEQNQIKGCINEAYTSLYLPEDGLRPPWASRYFSATMYEPVELTVTVVKGSANIICPEYFDIDPSLVYMGSLIKLGERYYTRVEVVDAPTFTFSLLEPVPLDSGDYTATFYFNSIKTEASVLDVIEKPELAGEGVLSPMDGKSNELLYRSLVVGDFQANPGQGYQHSVNFRSPNLSFDVGRPLFYFSDPTSYSSTFQYLFGVYPIPSREYVLRYRANVVPVELVEGTDVPVLPPNAINSILLPIAIYTYCSRTRRYNGDNRTFLRDTALAAKQQARSFRQGQKEIHKRWGVKPGYA